MTDNRFYMRHARRAHLEQLPDATTIGRTFYTPGKGYRVNLWRRIVRAIVRFF